jgi:hypothetical protein
MTAVHLDGRYRQAHLNPSNRSRAAQWHARWDDHTGEETAAVVAYLRELADGRADPCIPADADEDVVRQWTEVGRRRAG